MHQHPKQYSSNPEDWEAREIVPADAPGAVREYLDVLDDEAFGAASEVKPKFTAHVDLASQWTAAWKEPAFFAYSDNFLIDTDHGIIVDIEASRSVKTAEVGASRGIIDRTSEPFGVKPYWGAAGTAYGSEENLAWLALTRQIPPFIPVFDESKRQDGTWSRSDFTRDPDNDRYLCPDGKELKRTRQYHKDPRNKQPRTGRRKYRASKAGLQYLPCEGEVLSES